jgi:hypothetical protein
MQYLECMQILVKNSKCIFPILVPGHVFHLGYRYTIKKLQIEQAANIRINVRLVFSPNKISRFLNL